jgi:hypothetical protein
VTNIGPEFNTLREIFTKNNSPFEKLHPTPSKLFFGFSNQFNTPLPNWLLEAQNSAATPKPDTAS